MTNCKHTVWLRLRRTDETLAVEITDRPFRLLKDLEDRPVGSVVFVGNETKSRALAAIGVAATSVKTRQPQGEYHLHLSHFHSMPIIIGDVNMLEHNRLSRGGKHQPCHKTVDRDVMHAPKTKAVDAAGKMFSRVFFTLTDVVCFFVADLGGIDRILQRLTILISGSQSSQPPICPTLMLVVSRDEKSTLQSIIRSWANVNAASLGRRFSHVRIVCFPAKNQRWRTGAFRRQLIQAVEAASQARLQSSLLFSAPHTAYFLDAIAKRAAGSSQVQFDFVRASRAYTPRSKSLLAHLSSAVESFQDPALLKDVVVPLIASSFLLDHFTPGMHRFSPTTVYHSLYEEACVQLTRSFEAQRVSNGLRALPFDLADSIRHAVIEQYRNFEHLGTSAAVHRQQLTRARAYCTFPCAEDTCFTCFRRNPEYRLPCRHWICQTCVRIFQRVDGNDPWLFHVDECLLCGGDTNDFVVRVKPDTATPRVLSMDGGGARGRAPLEFLKVLQHSIALPFPVQRNFDVVYGTSSGAMIACALYINGWPIDRCIEYFGLSSKLAFERRHSSQLFHSIFGKLPFISTAVQFLTSLLVDSKYSADRLEMIQRDVYGPKRSIVDSRIANEMGVLLGVTLTSTDDTSTYVVTSHSGDGECRDRSGYDILKFQGGASSVPLWEVLRCCTAAPYYFTPHRIQGEGVFQDGGLTVNNPAAIALKETSVRFPTTPDPSIVVSLGTGTARPDRPDRPNATAQSIWEASFVARLFRAFWKNSDCNATWDRLLEQQSLRAKENFFRFDVDFKTTQPALDDVESMDTVGEIAREASLGSPAMEQLGKRLRAELFVLELDPCRPPRLVAGVFECVGIISCRLRAGTAEFAELMRQLQGTSASLKCQGRVVADRFQPHDRNDSNNYCAVFMFRLANQQQQFELTLEEAPHRCNISGSPTTLERLIKQQRIDAVFGTPDHRKRPREVNTKIRQRKRIRLS